MIGEASLKPLWYQSVNHTNHIGYHVEYHTWYFSAAAGAAGCGGGEDWTLANNIMSYHIWYPMLYIVLHITS